jgi:hypothetical protein
VSAPATITTYPKPIITRDANGGAASQSVSQGKAIKDIVYTANNSATITLNSGSGFPTGVSGKADGSSYTISGTPTATGTFGYSLTASNGCASSASVGTLTVIEVTTVFFSSQTWTFGATTWSDRVVGVPAGCSQTTYIFTQGTSSLPTPPPEFRPIDDRGTERYYYSWSCALLVCPSGWSLPTVAQIQYVAANYTGQNILDLWGGGAYVLGGTLPVPDAQGVLWSGDDNAPPDLRAYNLSWEKNRIYRGSANRGVGMQVRCVK